MAPTCQCDGTLMGVPAGSGRRVRLCPSPLPREGQPKGDPEYAKGSSVLRPPRASVRIVSLRSAIGQVVGRFRR